MGAGQNAIYLAKMGFDVEGVDVSLAGNRTLNKEAIKSLIRGLEGHFTLRSNSGKMSLGR